MAARRPPLVSELPREMTRRLGMRNRVELQEEPNHIGVWPDQAADEEQG